VCLVESLAHKCLRFITYEYLLIQTRINEARLCKPMLPAGSSASVELQTHNLPLARGLGSAC